MRGLDVRSLARSAGDFLLVASQDADTVEVFRIGWVLHVFFLSAAHRSVRGILHIDSALIVPCMHGLLVTGGWSPRSHNGHHIMAS